MFIARRHSATLLCSEERRSMLTWDRHVALPNRAGGEWLAGYKHCTPPEWRLCIVLFAFLLLRDPLKELVKERR